MSSPIRLLYVENRAEMRAPYAQNLEARGFLVEQAGDLASALELISERSFDAALVDLMLRDPEDESLEGLKILRSLQGLDEGTVVIAVSAQSSTDLAVDVVRDYGATDYVSKAKVVDRGIDHLESKLRHLVAKVGPRPFEDFRALVETLAGAGNELEWEHEVLRTLSPEGAYPGLRTFLVEFCRPSCLCCRGRATESTRWPRIPSARSPRADSGAGRLGIPVELVLRSVESSFPAPQQDPGVSSPRPGAVLPEVHVDQGVEGHVVGLASTTRADYAGTAASFESFNPS